ncbi:MAG TPA: FixG Ig-like domain-containing protein, partial [Saprospiraceae bacterium]|nr:FixG Ig-like domain-containing protein [Saprospiraceae bacterium]
NGTQMECVGCTACIDACDEIMEKVNRPLGLIRYASENGILNNEPLRYTPRMKLYTLLLIALVALLSILLITRKDVDATIIRAQGMLYQEVGTDSLSNLYTIKMVNKTIKNLNVSLKLEGIPGQIKMAGDKDIPVHKEGQGSGSFFIILPKNQVKDRKTEVNIGIYSNGERIDVLSTNFMGPIHVN